MSQGITFQLGPAAVRIEGDHLVTRWAQSAFDFLKCDSEPALRFTFADGPVQTAGWDCVGDDSARVSPTAVSFRLPYFEVRFSRDRRPEELSIQLRQRDRRPLWRRTLADPEKAWKKWLSHGKSIDIAPLKAFVYKIAPVAIQLALLERGASFAHASGFSVDGHGVLLPAWGGVGKSTLASRAVLHGRAKFLADDHALIDSIGRLHLHLLPVHLYAYHAEQDRLLRNRMLLADTAPNWQWTVGTLLDRKHAVRWISPVDLYGPDKMGSAVPIEQVVVMFRGDHTDFVWEPTDAPALVRPCAAVIFRELHGLADRLTVADAGWTKSFLPNPAEAYAAVCKVYEAAFSRAACAKLLIPRAATGDQLVEYLRRKAPLVDAAVAGT